MRICTLTDKSDVNRQLIVLLLMENQPHNLTIKKFGYINTLPVIDIPVTDHFDLRTKGFFCKYRPINISVAAEILINAKV